jgi:hypothetical protein
MVSDTASGTIASFSDGSDALPAKSVRVTLNPKQSGTGTPSPDNVRPISGWDEVETHKTGKNLLPLKFYSGIGYNYPVGTTITLTDITDTFTETDGVFSKSVSAWYGASMVSEALPNGSYRINVAVISSGLRLTGYILDADYKVIRQFDLLGSGTSYSENRTITLSDNETYIALYVASNVSGSISFGKPQIELGSTATDYHPYDGQTITTPLPTTVYGGTVDVVSGVLTVTHGYISQYNGEAINEPWISDRDEYVSGTTPSSGAEVVYELTTPTTIQCDPQTVQTLMGDNNVWGGDGVVVDYYADTKLYIEKMLGA